MPNVQSLRYTYVVTTMVLLMWWGAVVYQHHQYDDDSRHGVFCTVHGGYPYRCDDILSFNSDLCYLSLFLSRNHFISFEVGLDNYQSGTENWANVLLSCLKASPEGKVVRMLYCCLSSDCVEISCHEKEWTKVWRSRPQSNEQWIIV